MRKMARFFLIFTLLASQALSVAADATNDFEFYAQEAKVSSASRQPVTIRRPPVTMDVITEEEIRASGAVDIWDLLRFRAGMDVGSARSSTNGQQALVSVRGFARTSIRGLEVLVDGRSVISGFDSQTRWAQLPVQIQDIERIEIIRGPSAALYGANMGQGVINIVTKTPQRHNAITLEGLGGNRALFQTAESYENITDDTGYRISHTYRSNNGNPRTDPQNDFTFYNKPNFRAYWNLTPATHYEFFAGGVYETLGMAINGADSQGHFPSFYEMLKMSHGWGDDSVLEVMGSRTDEQTTMDPYFNGPVQIDSVRYETDIMHRFTAFEKRSRTAWGIHYRFDEISSQQVFAGNPTQRNHISRIYGQQAIALSHKWSVAGAASVDESDTGGVGPDVQSSLMFDATEHHTLRFSYALASTIPTLLDTFANWRQSSTTQRIGNPQMKPEHFQSYDFAYVGAWDRVTLEPTLYYMNFKDRVTATSTKVGALTSIIEGNGNNAIARGAEISLKYKMAKGRWAYANYTYESITDTAGDASVLTRTPGHKFNVGGEISLGARWSVSTNFGFKDDYMLSSSRVAAFSRLDARLVYRPTASLELFLAGQNLLTEQQMEYTTSIRTPRTYYAGLAMKIGGAR